MKNPIQSSYSPYSPLPRKEDIKPNIRISPAFRWALLKAIGAFLLLGLIYMVVLAVAILLPVLCLAAAFFLAGTYRQVITLIVSLGLAGLAITVLFLLFKFLFGKNKKDQAGLWEVTETDQPRLYHFIRDLAEEMGVPFPHKIYLSPDTKAGIFYGPGFRNVLIPVKANLRIGLGLVNALYINEFKAVLAQKFSHYSYKSVKIGNYLYQVNRRFYDLLYNNESYSESPANGGGKDSYFIFFTGIAVKMIYCTRWLMRKTYIPLSKSPLRLFRQIDFHADALAATVAGPEPVISSLRRVELADNCYSTLLYFNSRWQQENLKMDNLYPLHRELMKNYAEKPGIPLERNLPRLADISLVFPEPRRVFIPDQWASRSSLREREKRLNEGNTVTEMVKDEAWTIFNRPEKLQVQMTEKIYAGINFKVPPGTVDITTLHHECREKLTDFFFDKAYGGYYDWRSITEFDPRLTASEEDPPIPGSFDLLLPADKKNLPRLIDGISYDLDTLEFIDEQGSRISFFYFEEDQYKSPEAGMIATRLKEELTVRREELEDQDKLIFRFFYHLALQQGKGEELIMGYENLFQVTREAEEGACWHDEIIDISRSICPEAGEGAYRYDRITDISRSIFRKALPGKVREIVEEVKRHELPIRDHIIKMLRNESCRANIGGRETELFREYLQTDWVNCDGDFDNRTLNIFAMAMKCYRRVCETMPGKVMQQLLNWQLELIK